jgi:three-Cys-motif partner protein
LFSARCTIIKAQGRCVANLGDHEFGSASTDLKLRLIEEYLSQFATALRPYFPTLWYIDAFAGTGKRTEKIAAREADLLHAGSEARIEQRRGSAQIAIDCSPPFQRLTFIDLKPAHERALLELKAKHERPDLQIDVIRKDANAAILELIEGYRFAGTRAVMFLDPYGMHIAWETLETIAATKAIDVWYYVSLEGLFRQASLDGAKITERKRQAITRMLGTPDWERDWYVQRDQGDLFGGNDVGLDRVADVDAMERYMRKRLEGPFAKVLPPLRLKNRGGVGTFSLFFAISNPEPQALGLAQRIAGHILKSGRAAARGR